MLAQGLLLRMAVRIVEPFRQTRQLEYRPSHMFRGTGLLKNLRLVLAATLQGAWRLNRQSDLRAHGTHEARRRRATQHFHPSWVASPQGGAMRV
jgi:hypothetical protein